MNRWNILQSCNDVVKKSLVIGTNSGLMILSVAHYLHIRSILATKQMAGWRRVGNFYIGLIEKFEKYHHRITELIEEGDLVSDLNRRVEYEDCKTKISAVIRAFKRLEKSKLVSRRLKSVHLRGYMFQKRFNTAYQQKNPTFQVS